jgi:hypothetical protein
MADIDLTGVSLSPIGTNVPFEGVYDGQGYKLSNFTILSSAPQVGLIGNANNAHIQRVAAVGGNVTAPNGKNAALIVGSDFGVINDSYATGTVTGATNVGGVSGGTHNVIDCYSAARVTATHGPAAGLDGTGGTDINTNDSFAASDIFAASSGNYLVASSSPNLVSDCFYDTAKTCSGCATQLGTAIPAASYFYAPTNPPFTHWDFDNVWVARASDYPDLR